MGIPYGNNRRSSVQRRRMVRPPCEMEEKYIACRVHAPLGHTLSQATGSQSDYRKPMTGWITSVAHTCHVTHGRKQPDFCPTGRVVYSCHRKYIEHTRRKGVSRKTVHWHLLRLRRLPTVKAWSQMRWDYEISSYEGAASCLRFAH